MAETKVPITSVDAPSSWDIEEGPPKSGVGSNFHPDFLVSLTAPKPLVKYFQGRHFIGGRYVPRLRCVGRLVLVGLTLAGPGSSHRQSQKSTTSTFRSTRVWIRLSRSITTA